MAEWNHTRTSIKWGSKTVKMEEVVEHLKDNDIAQEKLSDIWEITRDEKLSDSDKLSSIKKLV